CKKFTVVRVRDLNDEKDLLSSAILPDDGVWGWVKGPGLAGGSGTIRAVRTTAAGRGGRDSATQILLEEEWAERTRGVHRRGSVAAASGRPTLIEAPGGSVAVTP
ncbi:hypothetical protein HPB47_026475, partial [Ixodes persulcatus]